MGTAAAGLSFESGPGVCLWAGTSADQPLCGEGSEDLGTGKSAVSSRQRPLLSAVPNVDHSNGKAKSFARSSDQFFINICRVLSESQVFG